MSNKDIIRAWKDEAYRNSLSEEQKAQLPEDPAGIVDVTDKECNEVMGGCKFPLLTKNRVVTFKGGPCIALTAKVTCF